jgi:hypothetical protein
LPQNRGSFLAKKAAFQLPQSESHLLIKKIEFKNK